MRADQSQRLFGLGVIGAQDKEIGIAHEAQPMFVQAPIQGVQSDIRQQWGEDTTLRRTDARRFEYPVVHYPSP